MEAQDHHQAEAAEDDDHTSGVVPSASVANSGPEVDVRLSQSGLMEIVAELNVEQRQ